MQINYLMQLRKGSLMKLKKARIQSRMKRTLKIVEKDSESVVS